MDSFVRKVSLFSLCGLLAAASAMATIPNSATSTCPGCGGSGSKNSTIPVSGFRSSMSLLGHVGMEQNIVIRDFSGFPLEGALVEIVLSGCSGVRLCTDSPSGTGSTAGPQTVVCSPSGGIVSGVTDALGRVTLQVIGAGTEVALVFPPVVAGPARDCGSLRVTPFGSVVPINFGTLSVILLDENGGDGNSAHNGQSPLDFSWARADLKDQLPTPNGTNTYHSRSDFSSLANQFIGSPMTALDLSYLRQTLQQSTAFFTGSAGGCRDLSAPAGADYCP